MRTCFTLLSIIFFAIQVLGQGYELKKAQEIGIEMSKKFNQEGKKPVDEKDIAGTPYLDKNFQESYILKVNGAEVKDMPLRYNIYSNSMEFRKNGKVYAVAFPSEIHRINMGGKIFIYARYLFKDKINHGYFQVLHEGDYQLLKKYNTALKMPEKFASNDSMRFVRRPPLYFLRHGDGMTYLIRSQKQLIKLLQPVHQPVIDFIKSNKINAKDEPKLLRLMDFLEENEN